MLKTIYDYCKLLFFKKVKIHFTACQMWHSCEVKTREESTRWLQKQEEKLTVLGLR